MNSIGELLAVENILLDLDVSHKKQVFAATGQLLGGQHDLTANQVVDALSAREMLGSTGLGAGVAVPHARIHGLAQAKLAFIRPRTPIPFDAPDAKPVSDIIVILIPEHATDQHLKILAEVAEMFQDRGFRERLSLCDDAADTLRAFTGWPE
ncbi:PTS system protein [Collimonas arenae]|uniref:PTS system protein n=1 Tax=Collimonas arenae TaxID=279058 RepID=A0A0A1FIV4_9BURK|nr:PTS sugar transporter subunit IIA [Collimonas arenae]AIY43640.1 PTS system protein [Collimonas arenae]